jgi:hypothetical protein
MTTRTTTGRWTKGTSGNPGGRPKTPADLRAALEDASPRAVSTLVALLDSDDERIRLRAAELVLHRVLGPPAAAPDVGGSGAVDTVDFVPVIVTSPAG